MAGVLLHNTKLITNEAAGCVYEYANKPEQLWKLDWSQLPKSLNEKIPDGLKTSAVVPMLT